MAHFAELNENNVVLRVVVIDDAHEADGENWCKSFFGTNSWKQTSYNTRGGVHYSPDAHTPDDGAEFRKNYAGIGCTYDEARDAFIFSQPFDSWLLNEDTCLWEAPVSHPNDGGCYVWDEPTVSWVVAES